MPVVIGEIEVETIPAEPPMPPPPPQPKPVPDPAEIANVMRQQAERLLRVRAD
jgi:hypothetical protein